MVRVLYNCQFMNCVHCWVIFYCICILALTLRPLSRLENETLLLNESV